LANLRFQYVGKFEITFLDELRKTERALDRRENRRSKMEASFDGQEEALREQAREKGRKRMEERIFGIDPALKKIKSNPKDIKVIAHPVDLVVFDGLNDGGLKNILFVNCCKRRNKQAFCKHLEDALAKKRYLWETLKIKDDVLSG
jgi:predicted Holliday junction resolvase-like endonuclease